MIKKLVLVFIAAFAVNSYAQSGGTSSPYSYYGIGSQKFRGTVENRSMGGLSVYNDSIHINLRNPASYATENLKGYNNESRPVKFAIGGSYTRTSLESENNSDNSNSSTFDYIALSIPIGRFGVGIGLMPYTSVGYKLNTHHDDGSINDRFDGEGGLNNVFLSVGYLVTKGLSVGVEARYGFGNLKNSVIEYVYDTDGLLLNYQTKQNNRSDLSGISFNLGASYTTMINDRFEWVTSATYSPSNVLHSQNSRTFSTITINPTTGSETIVDVIDGEQSLIDAGRLETEVDVSSQFTVGTGIGQPRQWFVGVEGTFRQTSKFANEHNESPNVSYKDAVGMSLGGFYIPNYNAFTGYWNRVVYRAGFRTESTGLVVNDESINEFGISFGAGLPLGTIFSNANIGFEIGKRGTTNKNLIQENFFNFNVSLSLNDRWFVKRKYD
ncbi:hypothetical protein [Formosa haliotis]|uniref:hypothetical protein n=1 Tax=Formosa haliotis TaxID=1555194 RepID=UPI000826E35B|nr:hypothetical protein [Formosa haliotis]